jgi:hypothetical protein
MRGLHEYALGDDGIAATDSAFQIIQEMHT